MQPILQKQPVSAPFLHRAVVLPGRHNFHPSRPGQLQMQLPAHQPPGFPRRQPIARQQQQIQLNLPAHPQRNGRWAGRHGIRRADMQHGLGIGGTGRQRGLPSQQNRQQQQDSYPRPFPGGQFNRQKTAQAQGIPQ